MGLQIKSSEGLGDKAATEPDGPAPDDAEHLPRGQQEKQSMMGVWGVSADTAGHKQL